MPETRFRQDPSGASRLEIPRDGVTIPARVAVPPGIDVRTPRGTELVAGCALLARALEFSDRDALPPWLVQTSAASGGLALAAFAVDRLVGFSFALPGAGGELFSCGLAVDPAMRGRGVGRRLKLAQRDRALALGATMIRWTADPLAASALALYLGVLGARLVSYAPELYAEVRPTAVPPDDVTIEWSLVPRAAAAPTRGCARIEIPRDHTRLDVAERARWRLDVREAMAGVLATGATGTGVSFSGDRAWVVFSEVAR